MRVPISWPPGTVLLGVTVLVLTALGGRPADAAGTTMGEVFADASSACSNPGSGQTILQTASPGAAYSVPEDGVITSWSFTVSTTAGDKGPTTAAFRLGRVSGAPTGFDIVGAGPQVSILGQSVVNAPVRIPAHRGDLLGLYVGPPVSGPVAACLRFATGYSALFSPGAASIGPLPPTTGAAPAQLDVAATLEPDADQDGFGDLSQDRCSADPTTQGVCTDPDTNITSARATKSRSKVVVTFVSTKSDSTFECAISSPVYRPCASPLTVRAASARQVLGVRAVDSIGVVDRTAAIVTIKAKKKARPSGGHR